MNVFIPMSTFNPANLMTRNSTVDVVEIPASERDLLAVVFKGDGTGGVELDGFEGVVGERGVVSGFIDEIKHGHVGRHLSVALGDGGFVALSLVVWAVVRRIYPALSFSLGLLVAGNYRLVLIAVPQCACKFRI